MKCRSLLVLILSLPLITVSGGGLIYSDEPLNKDDIGKLSENIKGMYGNYVYTVNAWSRIKYVNSSKRGKTVRWRRKVGTAFPLDECGYLVTPSCVVRKAEKISVVSRSGEEIAAKLVGADPNLKIAVLKIVTRVVYIPPPIAPRESIISGKRVVLLGFPSENNLTAQQGTISYVRGSDGGIVVSLTGKPGTTGTPVFDTGAQLLGILTYHLNRDDMPESKEGKDFYLVIPMDYTTIIARSIINNSDGNNGWLGIRIKLDNTKLANTGGIVIQHIFKDSPALLCGLRANDRIIEYNGSPVPTIHEMCEAASKTRAGDNVSVRIIRQNKELTFNASLAEPPR